MQAAALQGQPGETVSKPGLFESIINGMTEAMIAEEPQIPSVPETQEPVIAFTGNSFFVPPEIEPAEEAPEDGNPVEVVPETAEVDEDAVTWPEDDTPDDPEPPSPTAPTTTQAVHEFARQVKSLLAEKAEGVDGEEIADRVLEGADIDEVIAELPEDVRENVARIAEAIIQRLNNEESSDGRMPIRAVHITREPAEEVQPVPADDYGDEEADDEDEETADYVPEISLEASDWAGLAEMLNAQLRDMRSRPAAPVQVGITSTDEEVRPALQIPLRQRETQAAKTDAPAAKEEAEAPEQTETTQASREVPVTRAEEQETSGQDQQGQPRHQDSGEQGNGSREASSRTRTDTRRTEAPRTQTTERTASATTHRTDSRSEFAAYFEGVMTARRNASPSVPAPLNLRGTADFTQASTLRDGLTNVVRFIRADGVHKASVIVDPPALGRISVELAEGTSGVEATIKVASEQIRQLVQDQLSELRMNLSQQGVQVAAFTVDVQQDNSGSQQNPQSQERGYLPYSGTADDEDETEEFRIDLEDGLLYWVA